jgi:hypothetical protein
VAAFRSHRARDVGNLALALTLSLLCVGLIVACLIHALASHEAFDDPAAALRWNPSQPDALSALATQLWENAATPRDHAEAVAYARRALRAAPLDTQALRVLALEAENQADDARPVRLMTLAGRRSQRDTLTQLWLYAHAMLGHDPVAASLDADALLRGEPELAGLLFPSIEATLDQPAARSAYVARLAGRPDWRRPFLADLAAGADAGAARAVYAQLAATRAPPTDDELGYLLARLIADGDYRGARALWRRPGPALYDGDFTGLGGPPPFNWRLTDNQGAIGDLARTPEGATALHVQSPAVSTVTLAEQLLVLPPGTYRVSGEVLVEAGPPTGAFSWGVTCLPRGDRLGADVAGTADAATWRPFSITLNVPAQGCEAQWLRLSGLAHEGFDTASAWYRALRLRSLGAPPPPAPW